MSDSQSRFALIRLDTTEAEKAVQEIPDSEIVGLLVSQTNGCDGESRTYLNVYSTGSTEVKV